MGIFPPTAAASFTAAVAPGAFRPYSALHAVIVALFLAGSFLLSLLRRRRRGTPGAATMDWLFGWTALVVWASYKAFVWLPGERRLESSLPLQICDVTGLVAPLALLTCRRPLRAVLYFWGAGLSTLAFIYPDLDHGPASGKFWMFWLSHYAIVGAAVYEVAGRGFRPQWRDYLTAVAAAALYVLVVLPVDVWTGFDYGYVGRTPPGKIPLLDALGPWPWRLVPISLLGLAVLALLLLPFELARRGEG